MSSYWVHVPTRNITRWPHVSSNYTYSHYLGRKWVHGENYNPPPGTQAHSASDLALRHLVLGSNRPRILITVLLSLLSLASLGSSISISTSFKLLMKTSGCGVMVLVNEDMVFSTVFILLSLLVNIILATLIVSGSFTVEGTSEISLEQNTDLPISTS